MPLVYRTLVNVPGEDEGLVPTATRLLHRWLSKRGNSGAQVAFDASGCHELSNRSRALVVRHDNPEEGLSFLRLTTESEKPDGTWRTTVTAVADPDLAPWQYAWLEMAVDPRHDLVREGAEPPRWEVMPPEAARMLLEAVPAHDGNHLLASSPAIVRGRDTEAVDALLSTILDPARRLAVVATGTPPDVTVPAWREAIAGALNRSTGMCAAYVLDAAARTRVNERLPEELDVPVGGVRTLLPLGGEDPCPGQHPRMSPAGLGAARDGDRLRTWVGAALARKVRENALAAPLPAPLRAIDALLAEETDDLRATPRRPVPARSSSSGNGAPKPSAPPEGWVSAAELGQYEQQVQRLREEVKRLNSRVEELTDERQDLLVGNNDLAEEVGTANDQARAARHEVRWLRERVREAGLYRLAATRPPPDPSPRPPSNVRELLERITSGTALPHLFFTIDNHTVEELVDSHKEGLWVTRAWQAMLALDDYARYQFEHPGSGLGFHSYLRRSPDGYRVIPVKRLASQESDYVRNRGKLNDKRLFRVPEEVDPSGRVPMYAHIKLDTEHGICPRLYFYPDLGDGTTNRIYVGYLGRHLPVQQSN
ncbi:coiled-coil domain-containing protein [Nocardiopsis kunsanensis]|uniref:Uncharacterized protein n=1 Tax=Nocardiopsis kunsanensis TaxID=141693 RepID=A0A918XDN6_9ACTN|nr:hypothetical protein [Nocardiopsis kunsanensis]GHD26192.1 hypothetical protein GCM10007147_24040 [Nocardiopsis kunsanensis]